VQNAIIGLMLASSKHCYKSYGQFTLMLAVIKKCGRRTLTKFYCHCHCLLRIMAAPGSQKWNQDLLFLWLIISKKKITCALQIYCKKYLSNSSEVEKAPIKEFFVALQYRVKFTLSPQAPYGCNVTKGESQTFTLNKRTKLFPFLNLHTWMAKDWFH
jgi:hypothetical protein